jgi:RimJ/RimL family protein N-acetyltransferase
MLLDAKAFDFKWKNLHIRPLAVQDLQLYLDLYCSERVMRFIGAPLSVEHAKKSFMHALTLNANQLSERLFLTVTVDGADSAVAISSISHLDRKNGVAEIGSMVLPHGHGKRVGQDASIMLMQHIYSQLGISKFSVQVHPKNLPAIRAAKILGFRVVESAENLNNSTSVQYIKSLQSNELTIQV